MKKLLLYGMGLTLSLSVATASFAGNVDKKDGTKKECSKDKKACKGKCTGNKACCKDKKAAN